MERPKYSLMATTTSVAMPKRQSGPNIWFTDSGASDHFSPHRELFSTFRKLDEPIFIETAEGTAIGTGTGTITLVVLGKDDIETELQLNNVIYAPNMSTNLFSLMAAYDKGYETRITPGYGLRIFHGETLIAAAVRDQGGLFRLKTTIDSHAMMATQVPETTPELDINIWHKRMGHLGEDNVRRLAKMVEGMKIKARTTVGVCEPCLEGKQTRQPSHKPATRASEPLELIHSDLCGPIDPTTYGGTNYYVLFTDDFTRMSHIYPLKGKTSVEVLEKFREYRPEVEKQIDKSIKRLRTDGGGEYEKWMGAHLKGSGIIHETTAPYSPDQNGVAERANRTIMERVKAIIAEAKLDKRLWMEIADTVVYLKNRSPTTSARRNNPLRSMARKETEPISSPNPWKHGVRPHSKGKAHEARYPFSQGNSGRLWRHESVQGMGFDKERRRGIKGRGIHRREASQPNASGLRRRTQNYSRFNYGLARTTRRASATAVDAAGDRARRFRFRFGRTRAGHGRPSDLIAGIYGERTPRINKRTSASESATGGSTGESTRTSARSNKGILTSTKFQDENFDKGAGRIRTAKIARNINPDDEDEPATMQEAINHPTRGKQWEKAIRDEYESLIKNHTWDLVRRPKRRRIVTNKWALKHKKNEIARIVRLKARLMARGFSQIYDVDYLDIYAPVVKLASIRILLAIAAIYGLEIHQMDVVTAFLSRRFGGRNIHGTARRIRSRHQRGRPRMQIQTKSLRPEAGSTSLESTNSALPQINWIRSDVLRSLCLYQQGDRHYYRNVGGRSHYLRKGHGQHQRSQGTVKRRIRDEGPWRTQVFPRHSGPPRQGAKDHSHQSVWVQSNNPRTVRHAKQQNSKHASLY